MKLETLKVKALPLASLFDSPTPINPPVDEMSFLSCSIMTTHITLPCGIVIVDEVNREICEEQYMLYIILRPLLMRFVCAMVVRCLLFMTKISKYCSFI